MLYQYDLDEAASIKENGASHLISFTTDIKGDSRHNGKYFMLQVEFDNPGLILKDSVTLEIISDSIINTTYKPLFSE